MLSMESIILISSFLFGNFLILSVYTLYTAEKKKVLKRMETFTTLQTYSEHLDNEKTQNNRTVRNLFKILSKRLVKRAYAKKVEIELLKAEIPMRGEEFISLSLLGIIGGGLIGFFLLGGIGPAAVLVIIAYLLPKFLIRHKKRVRIAKINHQTGDCLTVVANSLRAGYSFQQAIDLVRKEIGGPLAVEFGKTLREINMGVTMDEALQNLAVRVESEDLELMITAVLIQRQIGGNLAEILDGISETIRERIKIRGEIRTLTAQGRVSGLIIGLMPPAMFCILMLINPTYMSVLITRKIGWILIGGGIISELLGVFFIKKVINIET
jgi:tight adherence protein B